jgi:hypothetical protein
MRCAALRAVAVVRRYAALPRRIVAAKRTHCPASTDARMGYSGYSHGVIWAHIACSRGTYGVLWVLPFWCSWYTWGLWYSCGPKYGHPREDPVHDNEDRDQARSSLPPASERFVQHDLQCGFRFVNLTWRHSKPDPAWPQAAAGGNSGSHPSRACARGREPRSWQRQPGPVSCCGCPRLGVPLEPERRGRRTRRPLA